MSLNGKSKVSYKFVVFQANVSCFVRSIEYGLLSTILAICSRIYSNVINPVVFKATLRKFTDI